MTGVLAPRSLALSRSWDPSSLDAASGRLVASASSLDDQVRSMVRACADAQEGWVGQGATAAAGRAQRTAAAGSQVSTAVVSLADVLSDAAGELTGARARAVDVAVGAVADGFAVSDDGTVTAPAVPAGAGLDGAGDQALLNAAARQWATTLAASLDAVAAADARWAGAIGVAVDAVAEAASAPVVAGSGLSPQVQSIVDGSGRLPADPVQLTALWATLSPQDKEALFAYEPGVGNRDGIPVLDRDHLNRRLLEQLRAGSQADLDALLRAHPGWDGVGPPYQSYATTESLARIDAYRRWQRDVDAARISLAGYAGVSDALSGPSAGQAPRFLMGVDGQDRAVIATNNPDTARNVATFVPGTGSTLSGLRGDMTRSDRMLQAAKNEGAPSTAVVTWYGYDAPPSIPDATDEKYAENGASALGNFQDWLRATHDGPPSHNVVVGHSYGTTVIGTAATEGRSLNADDVVFVGSPGANAGSADDLRLDGVEPGRNGAHVYATAALHDPVPLYSGTGDFGPNPAGHFYGSRVFTSDPGSSSIVFFNPAAHSQYWDPGNQGLANMGKIIAGNGGAVS